MARPVGPSPRSRPPARTWTRRARLARLVGPAVALLALVLWLVTPDQSSAQGAGGGDHEADGLALAAAYTTAWNAGDLDAVVALFAADGAVRQRAPDLTASGPTVAVRDSYGVALSYEGEPPPGAGDTVTWATGRAQVRAWARPLLAAHHRVAPPAGHHVAGDTVTWEYRVTVGATRVLAGVAPSTGTAQLVVREGQIASLTLTSDPASVAAREASLSRAAAASADRLAHATAVAESGVLRRTPDTQGRRTPSPAPWAAAAALAMLGGLALAVLKRPPEAP